MSRPVARPIAQRESTRNAGSDGRSRRISTGQDCASASSLYITVARLDRIASELSERDQALLQFLADCRLATSRQLVRRFWTDDPQSEPAKARAASRALKRLADWRVLDPLRGRARGGVRGGSATLVYAVGVAGRKLLARRGLGLRRLEAPSERLRGHILACTEAVVNLHAAANRGELDLIEIQTEPASHRAFLGAWGARLWVHPDLFVRVGVGALEDRWFIEVDQGTEHTGTLAAKASRYLAHYRSGTEQSEHGVYPRVMWSVPDARRATQIVAILRRLPGEAAGMFSVCVSGELVERLAVEAGS